MFKDLKFVKIILFLILAIIIVNNQITDHKNTDFIFNLTSYDVAGPLTFYTASDNSKKTYPFFIKSIITGQKKLDTLIEINKTYDLFDSSDFLTQGFPNKLSEISGLSLPVGLYSVNDLAPFVVSKKSQSDITVVFPAINNLFYTPQRESVVFESDSAFISTNLPFKIDVWTKGMSIFFKGLHAKFNMNYITDLDIENQFFLNETKLLILYGRLTFWTPKMMRNIERFINRGGNILMVTSDIFYAKSCFSSEEDKMNLNQCDQTDFNPNRIKVWNNISSDTNTMAMRYAFHSNYGGKNIDRKGVSILKKEHPIFKGIKENELSKDLDIGAYYLGSPNFKYDRGLYKNLRLDRITVLAKTDCKRLDRIDNVGGFFEFISFNGGKAIILGASDLCLKDSQNKKTIIQLFTNTVEYLIAS